MEREVIVTEKLSKQYHDVRAVSELSLSVHQGEIYGFLGLNGAGKTTTIRMLLGMIRPTSGSSFLCGEKVEQGNHRLWHRTGYLVEIPYAYPNLTVRENLIIAQRMRFISDNKSVDRVISLMKLESYANRKAKNLSLGNAQRLGLAKALIHKPEILILDEPSNGLDPAGIYEIRELLAQMAVSEKVTIFISSHILGEIARLATRIGIIHEGKLLNEVNTSQLEELCRKSLLVNTASKETAQAILSQHGLSFQPNAGGILECFNPEAVLHPGNVATILVHAGCPPTLLQVKEEDLESYFLRTIGKTATI